MLQSICKPYRVLSGAGSSSPSSIGFCNESLFRTGESHYDLNVQRGIEMS